MKKILLFADIGGHEQQSYYHVGDEAMFFETYRWYVQNHPNWKIAALSWHQTHGDLNLVEYPHLHWQRPGILYFPLLVCKFIVWWSFSLSFFTKTEHSFISTLTTYDRIHFTGGGNLSSKFRSWLYYSFFVMFVAKLLGKEVILTSQTIGPFNVFDLFFAAVALNIPNIIGIRSRIDDLKRSGIFLPKVRSMIDAAHTLPMVLSDWATPKIKSQMKIIGLSIHGWGDSKVRTATLIRNALSYLAKKYKLQVVLIPHHIDMQNESDLSYMKEIVSQSSDDILIHSLRLPKTMASGTILAQYVKTQTAQVDILLTTRYHGIIFGLSENIPTIALNVDDYYRQKNSGAFEMYYGTDTSKYMLQVDKDTTYQDVGNKIVDIMEKLPSEQDFLIRSQENLRRDGLSLDQIMKEVECLNL